MAIDVHEPTATDHGEWRARLDAYVRRVREAADTLHKLDQEVGDRTVWAITVPGLDHAVDPAELAKSAFSYPSIRTNPRIALRHEILELLEAAN